MDISTLTPDQQKSVMRVDGPLLISAGAGSGKTFTLTQRIAYALSDPQRSGVTDINEILAITFTDKAAGEIKERVKSTLRAEGMHDQALKVDTAWISTIHGMCSRMLRAHALEIGIDPGFTVISGIAQHELMNAAINEALGTENEILSKENYPHLFKEFKPDQMASMLEDLLGKATGLRDGLAGFALGPAPRPAAELARNLLVAFEEITPILEQAGSSKTAATAREQTASALEKLNAFVGAAESHEGYDELADLMETLPFVPKSFGNAEIKAVVADYQQEHARIVNECALALARPALIELMALAHDVSRIYADKKQAAFVFDNDDLLVRTLRALDEHPDIATGYASRFKMVMVDEFQDTSQIQIEIIKHLTGDHMQNLCTVGDYQQSIYRFRGADVNVYEAHKEEMVSAEVGALAVELNKNFRSHSDVLSFVERIFSQPQVFGGKFMALSADEKRPSIYKTSAPRITFSLVMRPAGTNTGVSTQDATRVEAHAIARGFAALRQAGHDAGDMVVLLGKMTNAHIYAQALRDAGFECVISGGSLFDKATEVHVVARLAELLANDLNSAALFEVLSSDMFCLSADDFIELSTFEDPETSSMCRRDLSKGFLSLVKNVSCGAQVSPGLAHAISVLSAAWDMVGTEPLSRVIDRVLESSGWLTRLQQEGASGMAQAGNILKATRIIAGLEADGSLNVSGVAHEFSAMLKLGVKEAPGALCGKSSGVVKIMTIHASKGLEFPLVALADFYGTNARSNALIIENCRNEAYVSLGPGAGLDAYPELKRRMKSYRPFDDDEPADALVTHIAQAQDGALYRVALKAFAAREELAEDRRKFYVGLTRASEALLVSVSAKASTSDPLAAYKDLLDDIRCALCADQDFPTGVAELEYGGTQPAAFERLQVEAQANPAWDDEGKSPRKRSFIIPACDVVPRAHEESSLSLARQGVFSYSSLAAAVEPEVSEEVRTKASLERPPSDADKATNLGSAFHRLAQYSIETAQLPDAERYAAVEKSYDLSPDQEKRLTSACDRWFSSELFAQTQAYACRRAELPFMLDIGKARLEGEIDLFCASKGDGKALVIDYKTGGKASETKERLLEKHRLQAMCYAYAVLKQGFSKVELKFVRVEIEDPARTGEPQVVAYRFSASDSANIEAQIEELYLRSCS